MCDTCNWKSSGIEESSQSERDAYEYYESLRQQRELGLELRRLSEENDGEIVADSDDNTDFDFDPNDERDYRLAS